MELLVIVNNLNGLTSTDSKMFVLARCHGFATEHGLKVLRLKECLKSQYFILEETTMHALETTCQSVTEISSTTWTNLCSGTEFWQLFFKDLKSCSTSLTIISPVLTNHGTWKMAGELKALKEKGVIITLYSRPADEHSNRYSFNLALGRLQKLDMPPTTVNKISQRLAIIDESTLWDGNLNILGFCDSREKMRRFVGNAAKGFLVNLKIPVSQ